LYPFFGYLKNSTLQPARHQAFTRGAKTDHLYDTDAFASATAFDHFLRNLLRINQIALKSAQPERRQKRVTYNNMPFAKPEKRGFLGMPHFANSGRFQPWILVPGLADQVMKSEKWGQKNELIGSCLWVGALRRPCQIPIRARHALPEKTQIDTVAEAVYIHGRIFGSETQNKDYIYAH
jgi:hypothetical protein